MKRARPWKVALLLALTGGVGFSRLDGRKEAPARPAGPVACRLLSDEDAAAVGRQCLEDVAAFLEEFGREVPAESQPLPPLDRLPPLPAELQPPARGGTNLCEEPSDDGQDPV